jgi:organic radical activating enzyme
MSSEILKVKMPFRLSWLDYPSPVEHCVSVYTIGCEHNCTNCSNVDLQNYNLQSKVYDIEEFEKLLKEFSKKSNTKSIVFGGGDPLFSENIEFIKVFCKRNSKKYDICIYTGYDIEFVKEQKIKGFKFIKCGKFNVAKRQTSSKNEKEMLFASTNQELYDDKYNILSKSGVYKFR